MYKVIIWGLGSEFQRIYPYIKEQIDRHEISVIGVVNSNEKLNLDGIVQYSPDDIAQIYTDYFIVTEAAFDDIYRYIISKGIDESKIIDGWLLTEVGFDFCEYREKGWLNNTLINDVIDNVNIDCKDKSGCYHGRRINLNIGRKSYIAQMLIDMRLGKMANITVGNYTSISNRIVAEFGLNMDHKYKSVMNYGRLHIRNGGMKLDDLNNMTFSLNIGSDVWIGTRVIIKGETVRKLKAGIKFNKLNYCILKSA